MPLFKKTRFYRLLEQQTCKGHAHLLSRALDGRLGFLERINLRLHGFLCRPCHRHANQLRMLEEARRRAWSGEDDNGPQLSPESRQRILRQVEDSGR